jgi:predicted transcriptional regulator
MTAIDLKNILIHRIAEIDDIPFLKAIKTILDSKTNNEVLRLTDKQKDEIIASKKDIEKGLYIDHEELDKEVKGWLSVR